MKVNDMVSEEEIEKMYKKAKDDYESNPIVREYEKIKKEEWNKYENAEAKALSKYHHKVNKAYAAHREIISSAYSKCMNEIERIRGINESLHKADKRLRV